MSLAQKYRQSELGLEHGIVSFCCQRCGSPLKLDPSLINSPDKNFLQEITAPIYHQNSAAEDELKGVEYTSNCVKLNLVGSAYSQGAESEFAVVGNVKQRDSSAEGFSHEIRDCTDTLLDQLDQQLKLTEDECRSYKDFLEQLEMSGDDGNSDQYDETLKQLKEEEQELIRKISELDTECKKLDSELMVEISKQNDLRDEEQDFLKEYNELKRQVIELENEDRSIENQLRYSEAQLDRLVKVNAFNATFHIWYSGHFGTINGFRLGRLPNIPVEWNEINAAWGQTVLLLHSLARKMGLTFQRYRLVPYGSHSYIESLSDKSKELPLYGTGGIKFFWDTKFDQAMVAFLDCLQQFKEQVHIEKGDSQFYLPYKMSNGRIEDPNSGTSYSIKMQINSEEQWTKALKFMLTNLRWGLTWVSSQYANSE